MLGKWEAFSGNDLAIIGFIVWIIIMILGVLFGDDDMI